MSNINLEPFSDVMKSHNLTTPSQIFDYTRLHLHDVLTFQAEGDVEQQLIQLHDTHSVFINTGFDFIRGQIGSISTKRSPFLPTYGLLVDCLKVFIPLLLKTGRTAYPLYLKWESFIRFTMRGGGSNLLDAKQQIDLFLQPVCLEISFTENRIPPYVRIPDRGTALIVLELLIRYVRCLCEGHGPVVDWFALYEVLAGLDFYLNELDKNMAKRNYIVECVMKKIKFDDHSECFVQLYGLMLLELNKLSKTETMLELVLKKERSFLIKVLRYWAHKILAVKTKEPKDDLVACMTQLKLYEENGILPRTICVTIQSIISYEFLQDFIPDTTDKHILSAMNRIAYARSKGDYECLGELDKALEMLNFEENKNDRGASSFFRGQALCLRALVRYKEHDSSWKVFKDDINCALDIWSENGLLYKDLYKDTRISEYTKKLLLFVLDIVITIYHEDCSELLEKIVDFLKKGDSKIEQMLWQFKCHHTHSERFHEKLESDGIQFSWGDYRVLIREGDNTKYLDGVASHISEKLPRSFESDCLVAQIFYDLGERMLLVGDMKKALEYSRKGCKFRQRLIEDSSAVAASVWSLTAEAFTLAPHSNFICYLMSVHQQATILEFMGNGSEALKVLNEGKKLSSERKSSFLTSCFHASVAKIHRKSHDYKLAKEELDQARIQMNGMTCTKCKVLLQFEIGKEYTKLARKGLWRGDLVYGNLESVLQDESKNGCQCWARICGSSLFSFLIEKGKDCIFDNDFEKAHEVFVNTIDLVFRMSSPKSQTKFANFVEFFEYLEMSDNNNSYGTQMAQVIYLISWAAYKICLDPRNDSGALFSIPIMKLICGLKRALVLSSEIPELCEKIAQLLSIIFHYSHQEMEPSLPSQPSHSQWARFFHQLTVDSGVNYLFSQRLRQECNEDDPDEILHRLTHKVDAKLDSFVSKFFADLESHTILVISMLGSKYIELLKKKLDKRSLWAGLMMMSRFGSKDKAFPSLIPIKYEVADIEDSLECPWGTNTIVDTIAPELKGIIHDFSSKSSSDVNTIDKRVFDLISRMHSWIGEYKPLMLGERLSSQSEGKPKTAPIILVIDKSIHMLPWEMLQHKQEFYRMPTVSSIVYTCYRCWEHGTGEFAYSASLDPTNAYYVIQPKKGEDAKQSINESQLADLFANKYHLEGTKWDEHDGDVLVTKLQSCDLFLYSGHGDSLQHIPGGRAALAKFKRCAAAILMGCMSGLLKLRGPYTPTATLLDYLQAGSPIVIGNLAQVSGGWALALYKKLLYQLYFNWPQGEEKGIASCLVTARNECCNYPQHFLCACNTVCYGVPTRLKWRPARESVLDQTLL